MCDKMNPEVNKCFELGCRYHMVADRLSPNWHSNNIAKLIARATYTCLWEIVEKFPEGVTEPEICGILKLSSGNFRVINHRSLTKLRTAVNANFFD